MFAKTVISFVTIALFLTIAGWSQAIPSVVEPALAQGEVENQIALELFPYTPAVKVLFEEMTLVQLLSEEYARAITACAGVGLNNVKPSLDGPIVLIPNAGDLSVAGSNVAIKLSSNGEITFIPRVQGQRILMPMDIGSKLAGQEVSSLTLHEGLELMAAEKLIWTAKDYGPYANGHGLPGHIAACDPRYLGPRETTAASYVVTEAKSSDPVQVVEEVETFEGTKAVQYRTPEIEVLFEDMTFVKVLAEEYARIDAVCAGVGLNNIKPSPDEAMIVIPNAGDLALNGSNVAIKLSSNGEITFIPRVQGQQIRVPMDVGDKVAGQEVLSLSFDEAMRLMAAEKLVWTAKDHGPYANGHGLPGHIAACDPRFSELIYKKWLR